MHVVSSTEFATHQQRYLDLARREQLLVNDGNYMFRITYEPTVRAQKILQPDDDLRRAITMDELRDSALEFIDKLYAGK
jgi:hypothetical protein